MDTAPLAGIGDNRPPVSIHERLQEDYRPLIVRRDDLISGMERAPATVENEETAAKFGDFIKQIQAAIKSADAQRVAEKEPYLDGGRQVDGFFKKTLIEPLTTTKKIIEARLNLYLREKAVAERRAREEAERKARKEAERLAREAAEREATLKNEDELDDAVAAEEAARQALADALKAQKEADAKAAELSRTRGDYGSVASLRTFWDFKDLDRDEIDLEALRQHLSVDALEKAVRSFVKAGGRTLRGVTIFENTSTVVR